MFRTDIEPGIQTERQVSTFMANNVTIKDIARTMRVNVATVSRALNDQLGVSDVMRKAIKAKAIELGYRPNALARSLVMNRTSTIAFLAPDLSNPFHVEIAHAIKNSVYRAGYTLIICDSNWEMEFETSQLKYMAQLRVDGLIMKSASSNFDHISGMPFPVVMMSTERSESFSTIDTDNFYGGFLATEALVKAGYRRIAYLGSRQDPPTSIMRREGYKAALGLYGLPCYEEYTSETVFSVDSGREFMRVMLGLPIPPDAVFCINDMCALGAIDVLLERGVAIPDEFGVIGFDDMSLASLSQIQLSTVAQSGTEVGTELADLLLKSIDAKGLNATERRVIEPRLILRKTTRPVEPYSPCPVERLERPSAVCC